MKNTILITIAILFPLTGCKTLTNFENGGAKVDPVITNSAVGTVGADLGTLARNAFTDYAAVKANGGDYLYGISKMLFTYAPLIAKGQADFKALVAQYDGTAGQKLPARLADLLGASTGTTLQRINTLAQAALNTAQNVAASNGQP